MEEKFKKLNSDQKWLAHYELLDSKSKAYPAEVAVAAENAHLNRYINIIPFDRSRVKLQRLRKNDYINANLVTVPKAARQYILTQGPLPATLGHFWLMVWEQKTSVIVMLNKIVELEGFNKCERYWPERVGDTDKYEDVHLTVTMKAVQNAKHYILRRMVLTDRDSDKSRTILHFQYTAWPDHGQPESPTSLLRLITAVRRAGGLYKMDEPTVVHCSAGVGRSGTFCLIDAVLSMVESQGTTEGIDIDSTLLEMRDYRAGLIQSAVQLQFAYMTIFYGIKILEHANKLHHHLSICQDNIAFDNSSPTGSQAPRANGSKNNKKQRRRRSNPSNNNSGSLNIFEKNLLADALEDIDSDSADTLFYDAMKPWPNMKKARNSASEDLLREFDPISQSNLRDQGDRELYSKELTAETKAEMLDRAINNLLTTSKKSDNNQEHSDSALLRRREREIKNQRLAERTQEMVRKMKEDEAKKESEASRWSILKKSALIGSFTALLFSSAVYIYMRNSP